MSSTFIGPRLQNGRTRTNRKRNPKVNKTVKAYVKKAINKDKEENYISNNTVVAPTTAGIIYAMTNDISFQTGGGAVGNLEGEKGKHKRLLMNVICKSSTNALLTVPSYLRVILFKWNKATVPTTADVLEGDYLTNYNHNNRIDEGILKVISDKLFQLDPSDTSAGSLTDKSSQMMRLRVSLKDSPFVFDDQSSNVKNGLWVLYLTDNGTYVPSIRLDYQLSYTE